MVLALALGFCCRVAAEEISVPIALQVELLGRLLWYERGLQRSQDKAVAVLVVVRAASKESARGAGQIEAQLARAKNLGGKTLSFRRVVYESPEQLKKAVLEQRSYLLYFAPGCEDVVAAVALALRGVRVLTVSSLAGDVSRGAVLGFELSSSKPGIALNLSRARGQHMDFSAQLLRIARVVP